MLLTFRTLAWGSLVLSLGANAVWIHRSLTSEAMLPWLNGWTFAPVTLLSVVPVLFTVASLMPDTSPQEFAGAPLGLGTLVDVRRSGLTVDDQPQVDLVLDVETAVGGSFRGMARQVVDPVDLSRLTPGTVLPVRHRPDRSGDRVVLAMDADKEQIRRLAEQILTRRPST